LHVVKRYEDYRSCQAQMPGTPIYILEDGKTVARKP
jgi:hypothetical protein